MGFRKYQSTEKAEIVSPQGHQAISEGLQKAGKTSMSELDDEERQEVSERLEDTDRPI